MKWVFLFLLFLSTLLNYLDRQTLSILKPEILAEFGLTNTGYSMLVATFMVPYIVMYVLGGRMVDRFGSRFCMSLFVGVWSFATLLGGVVRSGWQFGLTRFLLGAAEPGNFPAGLRAVTVWFPSSQRGTAVALFSAGSAIGAILAPPVIAAIALSYGWRAVFFVLGGIGFVWLAVWFGIYREPPSVPAPGTTRAPLREVLMQPGLRRIMAARILSDPVWYTMVFWFPAFLRENQGLSLAALGLVGWIPFLIADIGGIGSSAWGDRMVRRGGEPVACRVAILRRAAIFGPLCLALAMPLNTWVTIAIFCCVGTMCITWLFGTGALIAELLPRDQVASAIGLVGAAGALGGMLINAGIGPAIDAIGFGPTFALLALLHPAAALILGGIRPRPPKPDVVL